MLLKTLIVGLLALVLGLPASAEDLTDTTDINITRSWSQQPGGWTYPMSIRMPNAEAPAGGYPVSHTLAPRVRGRRAGAHR